MEVYVVLGAAALVLVGFIVWDLRHLRRVRRRRSPLEDMDMPRPGYGGSPGTHFHHDTHWGGDGGGSSGGDGGGSSSGGG